MEKGQHGYHKSKKRKEIIITVLMFVIPLAIYITAYYTMGIFRNYVMLLCILGFLPASRSLATLIVRFMVPMFRDDHYEHMVQNYKFLEPLFDMYFTSNKKNYAVNSIVVALDVIVIYTEFPKCDREALQQHVKDILAQNHLSFITIKHFNVQEEYFLELQGISQDMISHEQSQKIRKILRNISL